MNGVLSAWELLIYSRIIRMHSLMQAVTMYNGERYSGVQAEG